MDTHELETILTRRDLAAAESARDHVGPHSMFLANYYWRTQDWIERSLVVHMVQDQRGPHLRSLFSDFLRAPEPPAEYADHVELTKAVCLVQLAGDLALFARYEQDRELLRRAIQTEVGGESSAPHGSAAPHLLGRPTPIAPPDALSASAPQPGAAREARQAPAELEAAPAAASPATHGAAWAVAVFVLVLIGAGVSFALVSQSGSGTTSDPAPVSPAWAPPGGAAPEPTPP